MMQVVEMRKRRWRCVRCGVDDGKDKSGRGDGACKTPTADPVVDDCNDGVGESPGHEEEKETAFGMAAEQKKTRIMMWLNDMTD